MSGRLISGLLCLWMAAAAGAEPVVFDAAERAAILAHGPWPAPRIEDTSNRVSDDPAAIALGRLLFTDSRLSVDGAVSCASCHDPAQHLQDGRPRAQGLAAGTRNTPSLVDAAGQRWYGWDGASDSLWAASLRAMLTPHEMGYSAVAAAALVRRDPEIRRAYAAAFGNPDSAPAITGNGDNERLLVNLAKSLAAWLGTQVSPPTAFDRFRDALASGDSTAMQDYPAAAQRGLRLFIGEGRCNLCHAGPRFTNGEFADTGRPYFLPGGGVDAGRHGGLRALSQSRYNRLGPFADDDGRGAVATRHVRMNHRNFGEFKVPTLRGLRGTAPYMHDGSLGTLADVLAHYNDIDEERLHADGEKVLRPLGLNAAQLGDLEAFLLTLSRERTR